MKSSLVAAALACVATLAARPALACGGFFCSNTPINQSGERIVFAVTDTHVQAHVQIQYQGDARKFAWVLPLHAKPTISIGSAALFDFVDQRTYPQFQLDWTGAGQCGGWYPMAEGDATGGAAGGGNGGVSVVSQGSVGPYDTAILTATDANALKTWLHDNQYDLTPEGEQALTPYVADGYFFVALKLQQDKGVGDLRPVVLDMDGTQPCIPIRLTAIAAQNDMPITAFVLAPGRAVPTNYRHVLVNEARIDWLNFGSNYRQVASLAVDEAGGHAFLTEFAGQSSQAFGGAKLDDGRLDTTALAAKTDPVAFVQELIRQNFPRDGLLAMLERYVPEPASLVSQGVTEQQFYNQIQQYEQAIANDPGRAPFDAAAFAHELEDSVVKPLKQAQATLDAQPYLTRLFTTMSPAEMVVDPEFAFNTSLPDVSNIHRAKLACEGTSTDKATITLADGRTFDVSRNQGPVTAGPAAARIEQLAAMGPPSVITDNTQKIDESLADRAATGCGCGSVDPSLAMLALGGLAMLGRRRR